MPEEKEKNSVELNYNGMKSTFDIDNIDIMNFLIERLHDIKKEKLKISVTWEIIML